MDAINAILMLAETSQEHASTPAWIVVVGVLNLLGTIGLGVVVALWTRRDTVGDQLGVTRQDLVLAKIDALSAKVDTAIARHDGDIDELHRKVNNLGERTVALETIVRSVSGGKGAGLGS